MLSQADREDSGFRLVKIMEGMESRSAPGPSTYAAADEGCRIVKVGESWDEALPKLGRGVRLELQRESSDRFTDTRNFEGYVCHITFERPAEPQLGPYRIIRVR